MKWVLLIVVVGVKIWPTISVMIRARRARSASTPPAESEALGELRPVVDLSWYRATKDHKAQ